MNRENRRLEWSGRIADYKASGLTMSAWCTANHCTKEQLKYWLRKMKDITSSIVTTPSTRFVPLTVSDQVTPPTSTSPLVIRVGQASIEIHKGFRPGLLREVVRALETPVVQLFTAETKKYTSLISANIELQLKMCIFIPATPRRNTLPQQNKSLW